MSWKIESVKQILKTHPFVLEEVTLSRNGKNISHPYTRIVPPDWVNVLPITKDNKVVLIEQFRVGSDRFEIEIPGGVVDKEDNQNYANAALRELEEETGYVSDEIMAIGSANPNPAIQTNRVYYYIAKNCYLPENREKFPDEHEEIKIKLVEIDKIEEMVRKGKIDHCLAAQCILLALPYIK